MMDCGLCKKKLKKYLIQMNKENAIVLGNCADQELQKMLSFFQLQAPNISAYLSEKLPLECQDELLKKMLQSWNHEKTFIEAGASIKKYLTDACLEGESICPGCKRFICKRFSPKKKGERGESNFECLLRHVRNAIAHGRVFCTKVPRGKAQTDSCYIFFEDINKKSKITARIVCTKTDLKTWKQVIDKEIGKR